MSCVSIMAESGCNAAAASGSSQRSAPGRSSRSCSATGSSSASSSGGNRPNSQAAAAAATQGRGSGAAAPASTASGFSFTVSPLTGRLFDLLGVSQATVMQAAAVSCGTDSDPHRNFMMAHGVADLYARLIKGWVDEATSPTTSSELLVHMEAALLLSLLLLQWVDSMPPGSSNRVQAYERAAAVSLNLCGSSLFKLHTAEAGAGVQPPAAPAAPQTGLPQLQAATTPQQQSAGQQQAACGGGSPDQQQQQRRRVPVARPPPSYFVAELLPLVVRLCKAGLQLLLEQSSGPASPSGTVSPLVAQGRTRQQGRALSSSDRACVVNGRHQLAALLSMVLKVDWSRARDGDGDEADRAQEGSVMHSQQVLEQHAQDVIAVFEGGVRTLLACELEGDSRHAALQLLSSRLHQSQYQQQCDVARLLACLAGPQQSAALRQCYSFLSSLQRYSMASACFDTSSRVEGTMYVARTAAVLFHDALPKQQQPSEQESSSEDESLEDESSGEESLSRASEDEQQQQPSPSQGLESAAASLSLVPSLVIIGRCFLQLAAMLQPAADGLAQHLRRQLLQQQHETLELICDDRMVVRIAAVASRWLQAHSQSLAAAGYGPQAVLQQLEQSKDALDAAAARRRSAGSTSQDSIAAVAQPLKLAGAALSSLPVSCLCNNPGCTNAAGLSELGLVSGRSCVCGGCRVAHYCGRNCQRSHWKQHKPVCAALAAASAAAAPEQAAGASAAVEAVEA